jgi:hypothetical protein
MKLEARPVGGNTTAQNLWVIEDNDGTEIAPVQITTTGMHPRWAKLIVDAVNNRNKSYASLSWSPGDVQTLAKLSDEEAEEWLSKNEKHLRDRLCELGWGVMESLLSASGIKISKVED